MTNWNEEVKSCRDENYHFPRRMLVSQCYNVGSIANESSSTEALRVYVDVSISIYKDEFMIPPQVEHT